MKIAGSVILRNMRSVRRFSRAAPGLTPPLAVALHGDEVLVGWYVNDEPFSGSLIVFTDEAMTFGTVASYRRLAYEEVFAVNFPRPSWSTLHLTVETCGGTETVMLADITNAGDTHCLGLALWTLKSPRSDV